jgi:FkbM family methyltransferase
VRDREIYERLEADYFGSEAAEAREIAALPSLLRGCRVFVDVGASLGQYTFHANRILSDATLYAIEADPIRFRKLEENCRKWSTERDNRIIAVHAAATDAPGTVRFQSTESNVSGALFRLEQRSAHWCTVEVEGIVLDALLASHRREPTFIKMDVEGGELRALCGARAVLAARCATLLLELHSWGDPERGTWSWDVVQLLAESGYAPRREVGRTTLFEPTPWPARLVRSRVKSARLRVGHTLRRVRRALGVA